MEMELVDQEEKETSTEGIARDNGGIKRKKQKNVPIHELTREELEAKLQQLEAHNKQLKNLLAKSQGVVDETSETGAKKKKARAFDFTKHSKRHVLLKFCYLGWDYQGFAVQEDTQQTIEAQLFSALLKTRLIESRETSNYHRCGRTDKGVSAFEQVVSITLRSKLKAGVGIISESNGDMKGSDGDNTMKSDGEEIDYVQLLNKVLPQEIRMLAWCPVKAGFSARFDCTKRKYKYFFPRGNLDIKLMNEGAQYLVGYHDYRNFCKMDVGNGVVNFCRRILSINISPLCCDVKNVDRNCPKDTEQNTVGSTSDDNGNSVETTKSSRHDIIESTEEVTDCNCSPERRADSAEVRAGYDMCVATIEGQAFLWHQVRAIMAILMLVGEKKEEPSIVKELLDVTKHPRKPQYCLASDLPLNLYETSFEGVDWKCDSESLCYVISQLQGLWAHHSVKSTMIRRMLWDLEASYSQMNSTKQEDLSKNTLPDTSIKPQYQCLNLVPGARTKVYRPLLSRPTCESLETRVEHYVKRQRLDRDILQKSSSSSFQTNIANSNNSN
ncbi:tRNA pseudouridine(38/39) synthase-like [Penaeus indicus]|uniref:tRNA pseudouridine(38/39) synthase-like n=1 Tax=Penaeus indicus TaxID=29960 RepID=UPI00300D9F2C